MKKILIIILAVFLYAQKTDVISLLQNRYDKIKDFKTEFVQSYYAANGTLLMESTGMLYFKKKGMFRWDYETPKKKEFIIKGNSLWVLLKDDGIVYVDDDFKSSQIKLVLLFLYGEGSIEREFNIDKVDEETEFFRILLVPREESQQISRLIIHMRKKTYNVEKIEITDKTGNRNVFHFRNLDFDTGIKDSFFSLKIPDGVEVSPLPKDMFR
ncbi:MAG: outer membrane lipoprotein chaperone LolA [Deltaproteobacteria bacterium]|nr:outer membrane lipoprotein chaperone LolA [Deltaproteobacteria bacterium]